MDSRIRSGWVSGEQVQQYIESVKSVTEAACLG